MNIENICKSKYVYPIAKPINKLLKKYPKLYIMLRFKASNPNTVEHWNKTYASEGTSETRNYKNLHNKIISICPKNTNVIDIGCGAGILLSKIKEKNNCEVTGLDFSHNALEICKKKGIYTIEAMLPNIPLEDSLFNVVICSEVLEHLTNPKETIDEMLRILIPGGTFIFTVPYEEDEHDDQIEHVNIFTEDSFLQLMPKTNNVQIEYSNDKIKLNDETWHFSSMVIWGQK